MQKRLLDLCAQDSDLAGLRPGERSAAETRHLLAIASDAGCLINSDDTWEDIAKLKADTRSKSGSEHLIEYFESESLVMKVTKPPGFGLTPYLNHIQQAIADPSTPTTLRYAIEFRPATPLEYLSRWLACNEVFGDDVRLISVIRWKCQSVSFVITQPQYAGDPASDRDIVRYFEAAGWSSMTDPSGHIIFFHYGYGLLAIDAAKRNCYLGSQGIQPFDVILCSPDEELEKFLKIYPH